MKEEIIKKYLDREVLIVMRDGYRNYGQIEAIEGGTTTITTPEGQLTIENDLIVLIRTKKVRWS